MAHLTNDPVEARRIAETLVGDIALYNREKIRQALRRDALFEELASEIEEARRMYMGRVDEELEQRLNLFNRAVVDIIINPFGSEETTIW